MALTTVEPETDSVTDSDEPTKPSYRQLIKRDPVWGKVYRVGVGLAGLLLMIGSVVSAPLPGPGGIPLFLLGIAVWASEFSWAHWLHVRMINLYHRYLGWPKKARMVFWTVFFGVVWASWYLSILIVGIPDWMPDLVSHYLMFLPGVRG